jgi:hypothetical protein
MVAPRKICCNLGVHGCQTQSARRRMLKRNTYQFFKALRIVGDALSHRSISDGHLPRSRRGSNRIVYYRSYPPVDWPPMAPLRVVSHASAHYALSHVVSDGSVVNNTFWGRAIGRRSS